MASNLHRIALLAAVTAASGFCQDVRFDPATLVKFDFGGAPVAVEPFNAAESNVTTRGGALVIDLHVMVKLRNTSGDYIRGITLLLLAQEATPGGKMSVAAPSLNVAPGETFPIRIDGRLMRPLQPGVPAGVGPLVRVTLDGVLFKNHVFYGPDKLNLLRQMIAWEMQADRDRKYYKQVYQSQGVAGLQREIVDSINRQAERPHLDVQLARGRATGSVASSPDRLEQFAFLLLPDSPIKPTDGWVEIARNEAHSPRIEVRNTSLKPVRYVEIAWLVKDKQGREYLAGSMPASDGELYLPPGRSAKLLQDTSLRFSSKGGPVDIQNMTGFVSEVQYSDGSMWIPRREALQHSDLLRVMPPSPEEQRLTDLYRKGIDAVVIELNKF